MRFCRLSKVGGLIELMASSSKNDIGRFGRSDGFHFNITTVFLCYEYSEMIYWGDYRRKPTIPGNIRNCKYSSPALGLKAIMANTCDRWATESPGPTKKNLPGLPRELRYRAHVPDKQYHCLSGPKSTQHSSHQQYPHHRHPSPADARTVLISFFLQTASTLYYV